MASMDTVSILLSIFVNSTGYSQPVGTTFTNIWKIPLNLRIVALDGSKDST